MTINFEISPCSSRMRDRGQAEWLFDGFKPQPIP